MLKLLFEKIPKALSHFVFPSRCANCDVSLSDSSIFCGRCGALLRMIQPEARCKICGRSFIEDEKDVCQGCRKKRPMLRGVGAVFDYLPPASLLIKKLKYSNCPYLAKGLGAYLALQFDVLKWPRPDIIVPVPLSRTRKFIRGYNQSKLLADSLGSIIHCKVEEVLNRTAWDYPQAKLSRRQRQQMKGGLFQLKRGASIADKTILIIDDVLTTGSTIAGCAYALSEHCPKAVYALTVCASD